MTTPYERQPGESVKAYEAFAVYRDLGINRSLEVVAKKLNKSFTLMGRWSGQWDWVKRVNAYDDYVDAQARKKFEAEAIQRKADMLKRHALLGKVLQQKSATYLDKHGIDKSSDAIAAARVGVEMERKSEGLPEYLMAVVEASDDELARAYAELLTQIGGNGDRNETPGNGDPQTGTTPFDESTGT